MLLLSIILAVAIVVVCYVAAVLLDDGTVPSQGLVEDVMEGNCKRLYYLIGSIGVGVVVGAINYTAPKIAGALWLAPVFLAIMVGLHVGLLYWWVKEGSSLTEMVPFLVLIGLFTFVTRSAAMATTALWTSPFWDSVVTASTWILLIISVGIIIASWAKWRFVDEAETDDESEDELEDDELEDDESDEPGESAEAPENETKEEEQ